MERYLDCGNLLNGFARIKCEDCSHEYLLALVLEQSGNPAKGRDFNGPINLAPRVIIYNK
jgi:hypothetical protein